MKQKQTTYQELNSPFVEYLSAEELFLLGFLKGFNRQSNEVLAQKAFYEISK